MEDKRLALGFGIVVVLGIAGWLVFGSNSIEYRASYEDEQPAAFVNTGYEDFDKALENLSAELINANRIAGTRLFGKRYLGENTLQCNTLDYVCEIQEKKFFDPYGCGCVPNEDSATTTESIVIENDAPPVSGEAKLDEEFRLGISDVFGIGDFGDAIWIESFSSTTTSTLPSVRYRVYLAAEDQTFLYPDDQEFLEYSIEEVSSDYLSYVTILVSIRTNDTESIQEELMD
jgi:hypothetical protein